MQRITGNMVVQHLLAALGERHQTPQAVIEADFRMLLRVAPDDPAEAAIEYLTGRIRVPPQP